MKERDWITGHLAARVWFTEGRGSMSEEWVEIFITYDAVEADIIKNLLESGGISVVLRSSKVSPYPVNIGKMGEVKILVKVEDKDSAEKIIRGEEDEA
ncbi:MAG: hypothetical protein FD156_2522 [Nitrospirae bacterium]|nr:MAG: hypothetical protein FD156_2522 [Nitrospirota bacterium]